MVVSFTRPSSLLATVRDRFRSSARPAIQQQAGAFEELNDEAAN